MFPFLLEESPDGKPLDPATTRIVEEYNRWMQILSDGLCPPENFFPIVGQVIECMDYCLKAGKSLHGAWLKEILPLLFETKNELMEAIKDVSLCHRLRDLFEEEGVLTEESSGLKYLKVGAKFAVSFVAVPGFGTLDDKIQQRARELVEKDLAGIARPVQVRNERVFRDFQRAFQVVSRRYKAGLDEAMSRNQQEFIDQLRRLDPRQIPDETRSFFAEMAADMGLEIDRYLPPKPKREDPALITDVLRELFLSRPQVLKFYGQSLSVETLLGEFNHLSLSQPDVLALTQRTTADFRREVITGLLPELQKMGLESLAVQERRFREAVLTQIQSIFEDPIRCFALPLPLDPEQLLQISVEEAPSSLLAECCRWVPESLKAKTLSECYPSILEQYRKQRERHEADYSKELFKHLALSLYQASRIFQVPLEPEGFHGWLSEALDQEIEQGGSWFAFMTPRLPTDFIGREIHRFATGEGREVRDRQRASQLHIFRELILEHMVWTFQDMDFESLASLPRSEAEFKTVVLDQLALRVNDIPALNLLRENYEDLRLPFNQPDLDGLLTEVCPDLRVFQAHQRAQKLTLLTDTVGADHAQRVLGLMQTKVLKPSLPENEKVQLLRDSLVLSAQARRLPVGLLTLPEREGFVGRILDTQPAGKMKALTTEAFAFLRLDNEKGGSGHGGSSRLCRDS